MDVPSGILEFMLINGHTVGDLIENPPEALVTFFTQLSTIDKQRLMVIRKNLLESNDPECRLMPLVHKRYYQREDLMIRIGNDEIGVVRRGNILQLFQKNQDSEEGKIIINNLKLDFIGQFVSEKVFPDLPCVKNEVYVSLCFESGESECGSLLLGTPCTTTYKAGYWNKLTYEDKVKDFSDYVRNVDR